MDAGPVDTVRPTLLTTAPSSGATQVATDAALVFTFSEPMKAASVQVTIQPSAVLGEPVWGFQGTVLTLQSEEALAENTSYTVTVDGEDLAGNPLTGTRVLTFTTTGPAPDTTPPTVLSTTPGQATAGNARNSVIQIVFSEPMDKASVQASFAITSPAGANAGSFGWNADGTAMTFAPAVSFAYGDTVSWRLLNQAKDAASNKLETTVSGSFHIVRVATAVFDFDPATSGSIGAPGYFYQTHFYNVYTLGDDEANDTNRLLLGFRLSTLPESSSITHATLRWWTSTQFGQPFSKFGNLLLEPVDVGEEIGLTFSEIDPDTVKAYEDPGQAFPLFVQPSSIGRPGSLDVTNWVINDWANRASRNRRTQFRFRFERPSDNDGQRDNLYTSAELDPKPAELSITYEYP